MPYHNRGDPQKRRYSVHGDNLCPKSQRGMQPNFQVRWILKSVEDEMPGVNQSLS